MSYQFYLVVHLIAVFMIVVSLGSIAVHMLNGGTRENFKPRKAMAMIHGIGLLVALIAGFGLLAKLGAMRSGLPGWAIAKLVIWLVAGGFPVFIYRKPKIAALNLLMVFVLAGAAAYLAAFKPFSNDAPTMLGTPAGTTAPSVAATPAP